MSHATMMVNLELGRSNGPLLRLAVDLAGRLAAEVIGITACQPMQVAFGDSYVSADLFEADRDQIRQDITEAEAQFRSAFAASATSIAWRSAVTFEALSDYLAGEARGADLIISALTSGVSSATRQVNIGDLVMQAGRPVLIVPATSEKLKLQRVVIAWKDTRESRRSVLDALPLLKLADHVLLVEIAEKNDLSAARSRLDEVAGWLAGHDIAAETQASLSSGDDSERLRRIIEQQDADLIVAGAYGHSRIREWVFGGVTDDLLLQADRCTLVSH